MTRANTHSNGIVIDIVIIGKLKDGKLAGEKLMKDTLIKIDWYQFIHDHFWFGWFAEHDYRGIPRKTYWRRTRTPWICWKPMVSRRQ